MREREKEARVLGSATADPSIRTSGAKGEETGICPVAETVSILGDRWSLLIMRDVQQGLRRFDELVKSLGIATNILTDRLNKLTAAGLLSRVTYQTNPIRSEYRPTAAGEQLRMVILALGQWGMEWRVEEDKHPALEFINAQTGNPVSINLVDRVTGDPVDPTNAIGSLTRWAGDKDAWRYQIGEAHLREETGDTGA